jgi:hypothetical protein
MKRIAVMSVWAALAVCGPASARVGVTSATAGDPLGQPPAEQERVLRVGIDVQQNERVTTKDADRAHLVFLDGTSLSVGPNSTVALDKFVFDPASQKGTLDLSAAKGVFRLVGGSISKTNEITVTTPSASIGIRGAIVAFEVSPNGAVTATFLYGLSMIVKSQGQTETAVRPGSAIHVDPGFGPQRPFIVQAHADVPGLYIEKPDMPDSPAQSTVAEIGEALDNSDLALANSKASATALAAHGHKEKQDKESLKGPKIHQFNHLANIAHRTIAAQTAKKTGGGSQGSSGKK